MADTLRQKLADAIKAQLQTIKTVNGYETNMGNNVHEWRTDPLGEDELPGLIFRDTVETTQLTGLVEQHNLTLDIELYASSGATTPAATRKAIADVIKCIGSDVTFAGNAQDTIPLREDPVAVEHKNKLMSGVLMRFVVTYLTYRFDPYTQV